ncbi:MAG: hypothetical protein AB1941_17825 [Gemmatimonadota bacterium]
MKGTAHRRAVTLRLALLTLVAGATLFFSPNLVQRAYAFTEDRCSVSCKYGTCTGTGNCTCTCAFWSGNPVCNCTGQEGSESPDSTIAN